MGKVKLYYFPIAARAEVTRLLFAIGRVDYEEVAVTRDNWLQMQPDMPFGQVPVLELPDGRMLAQTSAIARYATSLAGLMPSDPWQVALADQAYALCEEVFEIMIPSMRMKDEAEKLKAREALVAGPLPEKLKKIVKLLKNTSTEYVAGDRITYGDLYVFQILSSLNGGLYDGIPKDILKDYPELKAFRNKVASYPAVLEFYKQRSDPGRAIYNPDA